MLVLSLDWTCTSIKPTVNGQNEQQAGGDSLTKKLDASAAPIDLGDALQRAETSKQDVGGSALEIATAGKPDCYRVRGRLAVSG